MNKLFAWLMVLVFGCILCYAYHATQFIPLIYTISLFWLWTKEFTV